MTFIHFNGQRQLILIRKTSDWLRPAPNTGMFYVKRNLLQYPCLENSMDEGAWQATVRGVAKSWTRLRDFTFTLCKEPSTYLVLCFSFPEYCHSYQKARRQTCKQFICFSNKYLECMLSTRLCVRCWRVCSHLQDRQQTCLHGPTFE